MKGPNLRTRQENAEALALLDMRVFNMAAWRVSRVFSRLMTSCSLCVTWSTPPKNQHVWGTCLASG